MFEDFDVICITLFQNTYGEIFCLLKIWWDLHQFTKHMGEQKLLEDLMRVASIYKTHGENNCLKIWWELHQFTKHMEKTIAWRYDESCINLQNTWREYFAWRSVMRFASIFCKTQIWRKILLGDLMIILQQIILDCL